MAEKILHRGKFLKFCSFEGWEYVRRSRCTGIVVILPMTRDKKIILVEQYRTAVRRNVIEFPAGLVNDRPGTRKESLKQAAARELLEETGFRASGLDLVMVGPTSGAICSENLHFFKARGIRRETEGGGDATENITVHQISAPGILKWLRGMEKKGRLVDPKVYAGLYFLLHAPKP